MLKSIALDQIKAIVRCAEALNAKHPPSEGGIDAFASETVARVVDYHKDQKELVNLISRLSHDARTELMALMWIGRDFDGDFEEALEYARENSSDGDVSYIAEKSPALPTYLRNGLQEIGLPLK